jgi:hypothetical protein
MESVNIEGLPSPITPPVKQQSRRTSLQQFRSHLISPSRTHLSGSPSPSASRHDIYYYYQSSDGQQYYLHSLDIKILLAEYGDYHSPERIDVPVKRIEHFTFDAGGRRRFKALEGVILGSQIGFCQGVWSGVLKDETVERFRKEIEKREAIAVGKEKREDVESRRRGRTDKPKGDGEWEDASFMSPNDEDAFPTMSASPGVGSWKAGWGGQSYSAHVGSPSASSPRMRATTEEDGIFTDDWRLDFGGLDVAEELEKDANLQFEAAVVASAGTGKKVKGKKSK